MTKYMSVWFCGVIYNELVEILNLATKYVDIPTVLYEFEVHRYKTHHYKIYVKPTLCISPNAIESYKILGNHCLF